MASSKPCCCSNRIATLIFLYCYLISCVWSVITIFTSFGDAMYKEFLKENSYIFYSSLFIDLIGSFIFLATIISISNEKPSFSSLYFTIAFLTMNVVHCIFTAFLYASNGVFDKVFKSVIEEQAQEIPSSQRDEFRRLMKQQYGTFYAMIYAALFVSLIIVSYSIWVFYCYITELKENRTGGVVVRNRVEDKEANFSKTSAGYPYLPATIPQYSAPMSSIQPPQYNVEYKQ